MALAPGSRLGPYEVIAQIGAGGMGEVWKARDTHLDRFVAIKTSHSRFTDRFEREARAIAALNHPHVCSLYDVGPDYLVMEYVEGEALHGRRALRTWQAPFVTCEGALIEAAHFCSPALVVRLVEDGDFAVAFDLAEQIGAVRMLLEKYRDRPMDLTDACIVRMSELFPDCRVFSVDGDFHGYRRFRDQIIPTVYPPAVE